jgi:hypothetical protein
MVVTVRDIVNLTSRAIKRSYKTKAAIISITASENIEKAFGGETAAMPMKPTQLVKTEEDLLAEIYTDTTRLFMEEARLKDSIRCAEIQISTFQKKMAARATRIKRAEKQQKKDQSKVKYFEAKRKRLIEQHAMVSTEASMAREANEEKETERFSRIR